MKKVISLLIIFVLLISCLGTTGFAAREYYVGDAIYTDIITYINHFPIPSYNVNGYTMIVAEDLRNYGFDVLWDKYNRTLRIFRNSDVTVPNALETYLPYSNQLGTKEMSVYDADIRTYINDYELEIAGFEGISGQTMIYVGDLTAIDGITMDWVGYQRAVKIWVDGMDIIDYDRPATRPNFNEEEMTYDYIDKNMPIWARPTIQKLVDRGLIIGDSRGRLSLSYEDLRYYVVNDRAGLYD